MTFSDCHWLKEAVGVDGKSGYRCEGGSGVKSSAGGGRKGTKVTKVCFLDLYF